MNNFKTRLASTSKKNGKVILANDYDVSEKYILKKTIQNIKQLNRYICAIKLNFHLLLPLGLKDVQTITKTAHSYGIQTIADIKLNDIVNTNRITTEHLWNMGFDAVIVNPIMGLESLKSLVNSSHRKKKGVITLCHMSASEARLSYDLKIVSGAKQNLYQLFLDWAMLSKADGIIVGATFPKIIRYCHKRVGKKLNIISPGIGVQGGNVKETLTAGTDYVIIGRTILNSSDPASVAEELHLETL